MDRMESVRNSWPGLLLLLVLVALVGLLWWRDADSRACGGLTRGEGSAVFRVEGAPSNVRRLPALDRSNIIRSIPAPYTFDADLSSRVQADGQVWLQNSEGEWVAIHSADCESIHAERVSAIERKPYVPPTQTPAPEATDAPNACNILVSGFEHVFNNCAREDQAKTDWNFSFGYCLYVERVEKKGIDLKAIEDHCRGRRASKGGASGGGSAASEDDAIDPDDCDVNFSTTTIRFSHFNAKFLNKPAIKMSSGNCPWFYWADSKAGGPLSNVDRTVTVDGCTVQFDRQDAKASLDNVQYDVHRHRYHAGCSLENIPSGNNTIYLVKTD